MLTALDQVANQNHLQMIKALIPYLQPSAQESVSICIKMMELQNILHFYHQSSPVLQACSTSQGSPAMLDILTDIRNYCDKGEQEMIDQWIQLLSTIELYSIFAGSPEGGFAET